MPLQTAVIGAWPKPSYLKLPSWFDVNIEKSSNFNPTDYAQAIHKYNRKDLQNDIEKATKEVLEKQERLGIDIVTDGEMPRENYIWHFCRRLQNVDFENPKLMKIRDGVIEVYIPVIKGPVSLAAARPTLFKEWQVAQTMTELPVKYTIPGPLTIWDTTKNESGLSPEKLMSQLSKCINREIKALALAGCKHIQLDEPCLMRHPEMAHSFGLENAAKCFEGVEEVVKTIHLCCGYPDYLDQDGYKKADKRYYQRFASFLDQNFDAVSIENAEMQNDLSLLKEFKQAKVMLGCIAVARSRIETVEEINDKLKEALKFITTDRLIAAPDCGLGYLPEDILEQKLANMVAAAKLN